jgi:dTDP-4-amino-4,6-dideoxygalactose transaminase
MMFPVLAENRDALTEHLEGNGVETRPMLPLTNQPYLKALFGAGVEDRFPVAQDVNRRGFYVGSHPYLSQKDLNHMADAFGSFFV